LEAKQLMLDPGRYCLEKNGNFQPFSDEKRPAACAVQVKAGDAYRIEVQRGDSPGEAQVQLVPAEPVQPFLLNRLLMPDPGRRIWIGGKMMPTDRSEVMMLFTNFNKEPFKLKQLKLSSTRHTPRPPGRVISRMEARDLGLPGKVASCLGKDNKAHKITGGEDSPPEVCRFEVVDAKVFRLEIKRANGNVELRVALRVAMKGAPPLFEAMLSPDPSSEEKPDYFEGSLEDTGKVALIVGGGANEAIKLKHILFVAKGE
jgi:hypothetical protein